MDPKALPDGQADRPRLADVVAEPGTSATLAVEGQLRILVEDIRDIADEFEPVVPSYAE